MILPNSQPIIIVPPPQQDDSIKILTEKIMELQQQIANINANNIKKSRKKKNVETEEYTPYKKNGVLKPRKAESIGSYDEFLAMQNYYLNRNKIRNWAFWTVGVSLGLRVSDLTLLKVRHVLNEDFTFRERLYVMEKKVRKLNKILITESVIHALTKYFDSRKWDFGLDDYVFKSQKIQDGGKIDESNGWRIVSDAAKAVGIKRPTGSHAMRNSCATIACCLFESKLDSNAIMTAQHMLNHEDPKTTMGYVGITKDNVDEARRRVSDFVLGKTNVNELKVANGKTLRDLFERIDRLEEKLGGK